MDLVKTSLKMAGGMSRIYYNGTYTELVLNFFLYIHPENTFGIILQSLLLFLSAIVIIGTVYFVVFIGIMGLHHFLWDSQPILIPLFVHLTQISSGEEDSFDDEEKEVMDLVDSQQRDKMTKSSHSHSTRDSRS